MLNKHSSVLRTFFTFFLAISFITIPAPKNTSATALDQPSQKPKPNHVIATFPTGQADQQVQIGRAKLFDPVEEGTPDGPQALRFENGVFFVLDSLNQRALKYDPLLRESQPIALPDGYYADLDVYADNLYLLETPDTKVVQLDAGGRLKPVAIPELEAPRTTFSLDDTGQVAWQSDQIPYPYVENRFDDHHGQVELYDGQGTLLRNLDIRTEHYLGSFQLKAVDHDGNAYVLVEELLENVPVFLVETNLWRFSVDGEQTGIASLEMEDVYFWPNRPLAITESGQAYYLKVTRQAAQILSLEFNKQQPSKLAERWEAIQDDPTYSAVPPNPESPAQPSGTITRQQIIANAKAYLQINWTLGPANYNKGPMNNWDDCSGTYTPGGDGKLNWRLPRSLAGRLNQTIAAAPYTWGGYQSVNTFRMNLTNGYWAGNICGMWVRSNVAGVDCSGYVSQVWQAGGHYLANNNSIGSISTAISWQQLKPGDILLLNNSHVMLFDSFANGSNANGGVWVYESSMRNASDRVANNLLSYSTVSQYAPRRYNNVIEDFPAPKTNLVRNGEFTSDLSYWNFWGEIDYTLRGGALYFNRWSSSPNGAAVFQDLGYPLDANYAMELRVNIGNSSANDKVFWISLRDSTTWSGALRCPFTIPANTDAKSYRLVGRVPARWSNVRLEVTADTADGTQYLVMDNVSVQYRPDLQPSGVACDISDPPPATSQMLIPYQTGSGWVQIKTQNPVNCSNDPYPDLWYDRTNRGGDLGAAHWWITVNKPGYYEVLAFMPDYNHTMAITPHARYWIEHADQPAGQPAYLTVLDQNQNHCQWVSLGTFRYDTGRSYGVYMGTGNIPSNIAVPNLIAADAVKVVPVGTQDTTKPTGSITAPASNSTITGPTTVAFNANAADSESGVSVVEFFIYYDDGWHTIGRDTTSPYGVQWSVPATLKPQPLTFSIHVIDRAGNEAINPSGELHANYALRDVDLGFRPKQNGYSFRSDFGYQYSDFTEQDFYEDMNSDPGMCVSPSNGSCTLAPVPKAVYEFLQKNLSLGHCAGMAATSLRIFKGTDIPIKIVPDAQTIRDMRNVIHTRRYLSYYQNLQFYHPMREQITLDQPILDILARTHAALASGSDPVVIGMKSKYHTGHAVTPYRITAAPPYYRIYVYDNLDPDNEENYIQVNPSTHMWYLNQGGGGWWGEDTGSLELIPLSLYALTPTCDFCSKASSAQAPNDEEPNYGEIWYYGPDYLLVTDVLGRRIGYLDGEFINEIPEAKVNFPLESSPDARPIYYLPLDLEYTIGFSAPAGSSRPATSSAAGTGSVVQFGPGYAVQVEKIPAGTAGAGQVQISSDGSRVTYISPDSTNSPDTAAAPDLNLIQSNGQDNTVMTLSGMLMQDGQQAQLEIKNGNYVLDNTQGGDDQYFFTYKEYSDTGDEMIFRSLNVPIHPGDIHILKFSSWDGQGAVTQEIDSGGDGSIDQSINLMNFAYQIMLPLVAK